MIDNSIYYPIILSIFNTIINSKWVAKYTSNCFEKVGVSDPVAFLMTLIAIHVEGIEYLSYYKDEQANIKKNMANLCYVYSYKQLKEILGEVDTSMLTWKLMLLQKRIVQENGSKLSEDGHWETLDIDWTTVLSFSKLREGSEVGQNKRYRGKECFQFLLSSLGEIFIDCKLCPGNYSPKVLFCKFVKRAKALGYCFYAVRADGAFGHAENIRLLQSKEFSLHYAIGGSSALGVIKKGVVEFKSLLNKGSSKIISLKKGLSALDLGIQNIAKQGEEEVYSRIIICRRIHRRRDKKTGRLKQRNYYYSIITDFDWSVSKIVKYYHGRQKIENSIKELKYHYHLNRMAQNKLKGNELYLASKILTMTMVKLFALRHLPKRLRKLRLRTLIRQVFAKTILTFKQLNYEHFTLKVALRRKSKFYWHVRRIEQKLLRDLSPIYPLNLIG